MPNVEEVYERSLIGHVQRAARVQSKPATRICDFGLVDVSYRDFGAQGLSTARDSQPDSAGAAG